MEVKFGFIKRLYQNCKNIYFDVEPSYHGGSVTARMRSLYAVNVAVTSRHNMAALHNRQPIIAYYSRYCNYDTPSVTTRMRSLYAVNVAVTSRHGMTALHNCLSVMLIVSDIAILIQPPKMHRCRILMYDDAGLTISVEVSGIGIAEENFYKVFSRFEKIDSFEQGSGLELAMLKALADRMGRNVGFTSKKGIGSMFYYSIHCKATVTALPRT